MFARPAIRACQSLKQPVRRYTNTPPPQSGNANNSRVGILIASAVGMAGFGTYFMFGQGTTPAAGVKALGAEPKKALEMEKGFVSLQLDDVEVVNHNTKRLRFKLPEDDMVSGLHVASALLTKFKPEGAEKPVLRPYTPISDEDQKGYLDLIVKKYEGGPMSTHIHELVPGQKLDFKGPLPKYEWSANKHPHVAMIAGGTGITPMYQIMRAIFKNPADKTKVTLVVGNITEEDILLKKQLAELENTYPQRFRAFYVLDNPPKDWAGTKGYITKDLLKTVLPEPKEENIKVFVCGPPGMMKAISGNKVSPKDQGEVSGILKELGYKQDQIYKF
ncbi:NADH-cytochrome b5 reductase 2 [Pyricularia oryzae 70-15]|uniref:NADH-cytochrome b5 reductase 2 n=3 Tax=Pyricularia oryzae TaxID=318829 RepID=MCR1_PYRO7|nr:NADH-cytochrome b5 reductase 2 [Pyricularia oryzae 70-15]A4QR21.1 RecName: Full=NADH-cytochrome b5 reductase 2; AltName: Full=Mitochondrial cytochrome b reductase [Pyricularia oryzae 70-15]ELQ38352.1 NADH-cytochrome b5 reductase [Pyricularia oryzae Y34]KAI7910662.1 NADH-cytochrome b5 reductase 2 [Pyricularia oryzae]EHA49854.1 NADH-cytochrome b5 reductase 2 [Pyricularia oryzae 70-15]KAI7927228.1 NADH-cytochrome b5 reductase 2 [Pyricularia oryzae]